MHFLFEEKVLYKKKSKSSLKNSFSSFSHYVFVFIREKNNWKEKWKIVNICLTSAKNSITWEAFCTTKRTHTFTYTQSFEKHTPISFNYEKEAIKA